MQVLFDTVLAGNSLVRWAIATGIALALFVVLVVARRLAVARLAKLSARTRTRYDDVLIAVLAAVHTLTFAVIAVATGARALDLAPDVALWLGRIVIVVLALQVGASITRAVKLALVEPAGADIAPERRTLGAAAGFVTRLVVWSVLTLLVLSNLGVEVTTLIAGLGVGGIAAALAVQNVLGDVFAAFSMYADRPFDIGDFVVVDTYQGTVERISWRSTQLRSLGGELVVLANSDLARARVRNYKRMAERRVVVQFGVEYGTPADTLETIPQLLRETIESIDGLRFDRAHFSKYGSSSLDFETVFYVLDRDYNAFMDRQQKLLLTLYRRFEEQDIAFALPTRTVVVRETGQADERGADRRDLAAE